MAISIVAGSNMAMILANTGGGLQTLPAQVVGAKPHLWTERITLASQASGVNIPVARVPYGSALIDIVVTGSVSLGPSTLAFGDMNNTARFSAAAVNTGVDAATSKLNAASAGLPLTTCYDYPAVANNAYEAVIMTVAAAALPASGTLVVTIYYQDYGVQQPRSVRGVLTAGVFHAAPAVLLRS